MTEVAADAQQSKNTTSTATTTTTVDAARRHLGRTHIRASVVRHAAILLGAAAVCAAARPFVWPVMDGSPWKAALRALILAGAGTSIVLGVLIVRAWRSRPSMLTSARRLDEALGLTEVVASGYAFERDSAAEDMKGIAIEHAHRALDGVVIETLLAPKPQTRSRTESRWLRGATAAAIVGLSIGAIDRLVVERTIHPVTARESTAADELKRAADALSNNAAKEQNPNQPKDPKAEDVAEAARRASEAAKRGDRKAALDALEDMRKASRAMEASEREQARSLRALRDEVEGKAASSGAKGSDDKSGRPGRPSATASEAIAKMKKDLDAAGKDPEALKKLAERLDRAEAAARAAAEKSREREKSSSGKPGHKDKDGKDGEAGKEGKESSGWKRAAEALKEAREAAARGDTEGAKRAMERAEREIAALEKEAHDPSKAGAMAKMSDDASELDRSLRAGATGDPSKESGGKGGSPKDGKGSGDAEGKDAKGKAGPTDPGGKPGGGPGGSDRAAPGPEQRRVKVNGTLQARTDVKDGERAVSAIEGMGRGGDPKAYREIFPNYDTVVEDGLREEVVPAARRPTVRRYFSLIRPDGDDANANASPENKKKP